MELKIKILDERCKPIRAYPTDSGLDLKARLDDTIFIQPLHRAVIPTGIAIELPPGYEAQVRPRSGMNAQGIVVPLGTIDNGYRGEIQVVVINTSMERIKIEPYQRIAQLVVAPVAIPEVKYVDELSPSPRGDKGFHSTGTH